MRAGAISILHTLRRGCQMKGHNINPRSEEGKLADKMAKEGEGCKPSQDNDQLEAAEH